MRQPVFGMDFINLQEAVFACAVAHKSGLKIGVDVVDDALVNIALDFALMQHVQVIFKQLAVFGQGHLNLLAWQNADEHASPAGACFGFSLALGR